ncbi:MAG: AmmeMemoRadiSam system radical SAM enzyme [Prevotella sp.]|jgi:pyruvate formate lyase activating enzyme
MKEAEYYHSLGDGRVMCDLCPHHCVIAEGHRGRCRSRVCQGGKLYSEAYGRPCALAIDPIEKKPLAWFHPGSECLSIACTGCNLRCKNCQNHDISQVAPNDVPSKELPPQGVIDLARQYHQNQIAYTYTEPLTWIEYMRDTARLAHEAGMRNILVSAGYVCQQPLADLLPYLDAANIDLKSFSDTIYNKVSEVKLQPILDTLKAVKDAGVWLEITHLLIPTVNDDPKMTREMCRWLVENGFADVPLHITRFFPQYKMTTVPPTPLSTMQNARHIALEEGIRRVKLGNV